MVFPMQPSQQTSEFPPEQIPVSPGSFMRGPHRFGGDLGNRMQPPGSIPSAPKRNKIQTMLAKVLPTGGAQQVTSSPAHAVNGPKTSGGGITSTLSNVQQVLNIVQQSAPIVKEYGPMVKNIPAMLRMAKAFHNLNDEEPEANAEEYQDKQSNKHMEKTPKAAKENVTGTAQTKEHPTSQSGESKPLLFI